MNNIEKLVKQYGELVRKIALSNVKNREYADDIFQDTFIKVIENKDNIDYKKNIQGYITSILYNVIRDFYRKKYKVKELAVDEVYASVEYENYSYNPFCEKDDYDEIKHYITELPYTYIRVIDCIYYKQMSIRETALYLGITEKNVKIRLYRAKMKLKENKHLYRSLGYENF